MLTDPAFISRLESLYLLSRKVLAGSLHADRRSVRKGAGITFADYTEYYPGADYRSIDWRVFAKFETLVVKMFELEEDATVHILLDNSRSMSTKMALATQLAASLGYIALHSLDRLAVYTLHDELQCLLDPCRGRSHTWTLLKALDAIEVGGCDTDFGRACRHFQARRQRKGIVLVISDFLFPAGYEEGLRFLQFHGHDVYCLQIRDDHDAECHETGAVELVCTETGRTREVRITQREIRQFRELLAAWHENLQQTCRQLGVGFAATNIDMPFDAVVEDVLRRGGLVA